MSAKSYFELLFALFRKEIAVRYKQSYIGPMWSVLQPLILLSIFVILDEIVDIGGGGYPYPLVVFAGILPWTFFSNSITSASNSIVGNAAIIKKMGTPRLLFPIASISACLYDLIVSLIILLFLLLSYDMKITWHIVFLPVLVVFEFVLILGISLLTSSLAAYRRDVLVGIPYILQFVFFVSPVMYTVDLVPEKWKFLYMLNPVAGIIESYRCLFLYNTLPMFEYFLFPLAITMLSLFVGYYVFSRLEHRFADVV